MEEKKVLTTSADDVSDSGNNERRGGAIRIGTCSWADKSLTSSGWYPRSARSPAARLSHYARQFDTVEADTTFYAIPD
ncbi:MAG: DUF72 domain-containing protein, partial [Synergistaceae bacterium]|nr:DUF72 domain-containing protein [Synergistaceae bacterium]